MVSGMVPHGRMDVEIDAIGECEQHSEHGDSWGNHANCYVCVANRKLELAKKDYNEALLAVSEHDSAWGGHASYAAYAAYWKLGLAKKDAHDALLAAIARRAPLVNSVLPKLAEQFRLPFQVIDSHLREISRRKFDAISVANSARLRAPTGD